MMNATSLLETLKSSFSSCTVLEGDMDAIRCERAHKGRARSVYFFRETNQLPGPDGLDEIHTKVLAPSYFRAEDYTRWNQYFVFVAHDEMREDRTFRSAKSFIESDKSYARKIVVFQSDLNEFLDRKIDRSSAGSPKSSVLTEWTNRLSEAGLSVIQTDAQRAPIVRAIKGGAYMPEVKEPKATSAHVEPLNELKALSYLDIAQFGTRRIRGKFNFAQVNLIYGPNGSGKTSLLEAIEHYFCGSTYRSHGNQEEFAAIAAFTDGKVSKYKAITNAEALARDQRWYGHTPPKGKNQLCHGFARFNFLNADAAVEFSYDSELQNLTESLSKIALGPEASFTWTRIALFIDDIEKALSPLESDLAMLQKQLIDGQARMSALATASPQLEVLAASAVSALNELNWPGALAPSETPGPEWFSQYSALEYMNYLASETKFPDSSELLNSSFDALSALLSEVTMLEANERSHERNQNQLAMRAMEIEQDRASLERLSVYTQHSFRDLVDSGRELESKQDKLNRKLLPRDEFAALEIAAVDLDATSNSLAVFKEMAFANLVKAQADLASATKYRGELQAVLAKTDAILANIRSLGREFVVQAPDANECPLCRTEMNMNSLVSRIDKVSNSRPASTDLEALGLVISNLQTRIGLLTTTIAGTERLLGQSIAGDHRSIKECLNECRREYEEYLRVVEKIDAIKPKLNELKELQLSQRELDSLESILTKIVNVGDSAESIRASHDSLALARMKLLEAEESASKIGIELRTELSTTDKRKSVLFTQYGVSNMEMLRLQLQQELDLRKRQLDAFNGFPNEVKDKFRENVTSLISLTKSASEALQLLSTQIQKEQSKNSELAIVKHQIELNSQSMGVRKIERDRLADALSVLHDLRDNHSLDAGLAEFFASNQVAIQRVFAQIHVPNELQISDISACKIERVGLDGSVGLNQISTGQRAALVLSIYIALNLSLRKAPPFMLMDDPIAHIDDLNILSFLDYLGDVSESGYRQIFFATANEKLANLLEKKMEFLGSDFRRIDLARDDIEQDFGEVNETKH